LAVSRFCFASSDIGISAQARTKTSCTYAHCYTWHSPVMQLPEARLRALSSLGSLVWQGKKMFRYKSDGTKDTLYMRTIAMIHSFQDWKDKSRNRRGG
jgi:hypothetical protein